MGTNTPPTGRESVAAYEFSEDSQWCCEVQLTTLVVREGREMRGSGPNGLARRVGTNGCGLQPWVGADCARRGTRERTTNGRTEQSRTVTVTDAVQGVDSGDGERGL